VWINDIDELLKKYSVKEVMEVLDQIEAMGTRVKRLCPYSCEICEQKFKKDNVLNDEIIVLFYHGEQKWFRAHKKCAEKIGISFNVESTR